MRRLCRVKTLEFEMCYDVERSYIEKVEILNEGLEEGPNIRPPFRTGRTESQLELRPGSPAATPAQESEEERSDNFIKQVKEISVKKETKVTTPRGAKKVPEGVRRWRYWQ